MTAQAVDLEKLRVALRRLGRGELIRICERAIELGPRAKLATLVGDVVQLDERTQSEAGVVPLLSEVRAFHEASMRGDYYESFDVNSKNFMDTSKGTEAFMAELDRLVSKCIRALEAQGPEAPLCESFELLFGLLRYIDECNDDVLRRRSWGVASGCGLARRPAGLLPMAGRYRRFPDELAREVHRAIRDFAGYERPRTSPRRAGWRAPSSVAPPLTGKAGRPSIRNQSL